MPFLELCRKSRSVILAGLPVAKSGNAPPPVLKVHGMFDSEYQAVEEEARARGFSCLASTTSMVVDGVFIGVAFLAYFTDRLGGLAVLAGLMPNSVPAAA